MNDYDRIAQVIRYIDEHQVEQPDLATLAKCIGLSQFHFHRLFSDWAGITPKEFLQCLTLTHARKLLHEGNSVLDTTINTGLSSPGRLHDLCIKLEAATPGEIKSGGEGWTINYGFGESPFGKCLIAESPRGICHIAFVDSADEPIEINELYKNWPKAKMHRDDYAASELINLIFKQPEHAISTPGLKAFVKGTAFQVQVWRALIQIPPGKLASYGQVAKTLGKPDAARSVGTAIGKNPLAYLIPCHRVIRETGAISSYHWGKDRQRAIIAWESSPKISNETSSKAKKTG